MLVSEQGVLSIDMMYPPTMIRPALNNTINNSNNNNNNKNNNNNNNINNNNNNKINDTTVVARIVEMLEFRLGLPGRFCVFLLKV